MSYTARSLIPGWKLRDFKHKLPKDYQNRTYVAVSAKKFNAGICKVLNKDQCMTVKEEDAIHSIEFPDKQGRNEWYKLLYFEWIPDIIKDLFPDKYNTPTTNEEKLSLDK